MKHISLIFTIMLLTLGFASESYFDLYPKLGEHPYEYWHGDGVEMQKGNLMNTVMVPQISSKAGAMFKDFPILKIPTFMGKTLRLHKKEFQKILEWNGSKESRTKRNVEFCNEASLIQFRPELKVYEVFENAVNESKITAMEYYPSSCSDFSAADPLMDVYIPQLSDGVLAVIFTNDTLPLVKPTIENHLVGLKCSEVDVYESLHKKYEGYPMCDQENKRYLLDFDEDSIPDVVIYRIERTTYVGGVCISIGAMIGRSSKWYQSSYFRSVSASESSPFFF